MGRSQASCPRRGPCCAPDQRLIYAAHWPSQNDCWYWQDQKPLPFTIFGAPFLTFCVASIIAGQSNSSIPRGQTTLCERNASFNRRESLRSPRCSRPINSRAALTINVRFEEAALRHWAWSRTDADLEAKLDEWERFYNFARRRGAHNGQTPYEALRDKLQ